MSRVYNLCDALEQQSGFEFLFKVAPTTGAEMQIEAGLMPILLQAINEATQRTSNDRATIAARNELMEFHQQLVSGCNGGTAPPQTKAAISGPAFGLLVKAICQSLERLSRSLVDKSDNRNVNFEIRSLVNIVARGLKGFYKNGNCLNQTAFNLVTGAVLEVNS